MIEAGAFRSETLIRAGLALTATGIVSAASIYVAIDQRSEVPLALGFVAYLAVILLGAVRHQFRRAPLITLGLFAVAYLAVSVGVGGSAVGMVLYVVAAALAYWLTSPTFRPLAVAAFALWTPALRLLGPDPTAGMFPWSLAIAALLALFFLVGVLLSRRDPDPTERVRQIGLGLLGVACVATVVERHLVVASLSIAPDDVMALVVVALIPILAIARIRPTLRDALATGLALATLALVGIADIQGKPYHVDAVTVPHYAAELLLAGRDPYQDFDVEQALAHYGVLNTLLTKLESGAVIHSLNYPALSFLSVTPFVALGLADVRVLYLAEILLLVLITMRRVRVPWRPLIAAAVVGNTIIVRQNVLAGVDPLWAVLLALAFLFIEHRVLSPIGVGLAAADRQPAWFFAPFYLLVVWRRDGPREALRRGM